MKQLSHLSEIEGLFHGGSTIVIHTGCAAPKALTQQLVELAKHRGPFEVFDLLTLGSPAYINAIEYGHIRLTTIVPGRPVRRGLKSGQVRIIRQPMSVVTSLFSSGKIQADILLLHVSPPDENGAYSLGVSCDTMLAALAQDPIVIAEINPDMPCTFGANSIRAEDIDYFINGSGSPLTIVSSSWDDADDAIADNVASLIENGDVLQTGFGSIPDLTVTRLTHLSHLGIHTGIMTEALRPLIDKGIVTNGGKKAHRGISVTTMAAGSESFYRFLHENRAVEFHPCDYTHGFSTLAEVEHLCAINGALEVGLDGNVNAEIIDGRLISAPGGQPDFAAGAAATPGGKSIIALRATSKDGMTSRIVGALQPETPATLNGNMVDYVVTEIGIARISGLTGLERSLALIEVAAPQFRSDLRRLSP